MQEKGSAFISVLLILLLLSFLTITISQYSSNGVLFFQMKSVFLKNLWLARGAENIVMHQLASQKINRHIKTKTIENLTFEYSIQNHWLYIKTKNESPNVVLKHKLQYLDFQDCALLYNSNLILVANEKEEKIIQCPIFVNGILKLIINGSMVLKNDNQFSLPVVYYGSFLFSTVSNAKKSFLALEKTSHNKRISSIVLIKNGKKFDYLLNKNEMTNFLLKIKSDFVFPTLKNIGEKLRDFNSIVFVNANNWKKKEFIVNSRLLEKELIGIGNGFKKNFLLQNRKYIDNIYFSSNLNSQLLNPLYAIDSCGYEKDFIFTHNMLTIMNKVFPLKLQRSDCNRINQFQYGNKFNIASSIYRNIKEVYLNGEKLIEGREFIIDKKKRIITLISPDFIQDIGRGDGVRKNFPMPTGFSYQSFLFVGGILNKHYKLTNNEIIFFSPPPYKAKIQWYNKPFSISVSKENVPEGVGIFVDKKIEVLKVDLSKLKNREGTILFFNSPILVFGKAKRQYVIYTKEDVYFKNIIDGKNICIYGKIFWNLNKSSPLILKNVFLFSAGDNIYNLGNNKVSKTIYGTLAFSCEYSYLKKYLTRRSRVDKEDDFNDIIIKQTTSRRPFLYTPFIFY